MTKIEQISVDKEEKEAHQGEHVVDYVLYPFAALVQVRSLRFLQLTNQIAKRVVQPAITWSRSRLNAHAWAPHWNQRIEKSAHVAQSEQVAAGFGMRGKLAK